MEALLGLQRLKRKGGDRYRSLTGHCRATAIALATEAPKVVVNYAQLPSSPRKWWEKSRLWEARRSL
jgi:hypothetical protein